MDLCRDHKIAKVNCWLTGCRRHFASSSSEANLTIVDPVFRHVKALLERASYRIQMFLFETMLKPLSGFLITLTTTSHCCGFSGCNGSFRVQAEYGSHSGNEAENGFFARNCECLRL